MAYDGDPMIDEHSLSRGPSTAKAVSALLVLVLTIAACSDDRGEAISVVSSSTLAPAADTSDPVSAPDDTDSADADAGDSGSDDSGSDDPDGDDGTDSDDTDSSGPDSDDSTTLPGEPFNDFVDAGDLLAVMGVAHNDDLNVRAGPGTDQPVVTTLDPLAEDLVATGRGRILSASIWYEIEVGSETGWVSTAFIAFQGTTDDATAEFRLDHPDLRAETMIDLAQMVAEVYASDEPPSRIVQSTRASVGDLGSVTFDVVGLGDDAVAGYRLHVFGAPDEDGGEGFSLRNIERTFFCSRGTSGRFCT